MTLFADLGPDEQQVLLRSLEAAAVVISASSPGRKEETASEGFAMAEYVLDSRASHFSNPLIESVIQALVDRAKTEQSFPDYVKVASAPGAREDALAILRSAVAVLDAKATPEEASGFRTWLMGIATRVAEAGKEDQGFLGRGGVLVNDAERAALGEIAGVLGVEAPPA
jgi:hypothetical protein